MQSKLHKVALSHANAYLYDELWNNDDRLKSSFEHWEKAIAKAKSIKELVALEKSLHDVLWQNHTPTVYDFYQAMLKVTPFRIAEDKKQGEVNDISWYEHSGTECRGWFRVWASIKRKSGYFCRWDLGRDQWMAEAFWRSGCWTDKEWADYKTYITMKQYIHEDFDIDKVKAYWKPECISKVLDMRLVDVLSSGIGHNSFGIKEMV